MLFISFKVAPHIVQACDAKSDRCVFQHHRDADRMEYL